MSEGESKKGTSGCLIVGLVVVIGGFAVCGGVGAYAYFGVKNNPQIASMVDGFKGFTDVMRAASTGPGPDFLREHGCKTATVIDAGKLRAVIAQFDAANGKNGNVNTQSNMNAPTAVMDPLTFAVAQCESPPPTLTCDELSQKLAGLIGGPSVKGHTFTLSIDDVTPGRPSAQRCSGKYDAFGKPVVLPR